MKIEKTKKNYNVKIVFLDEDNNEVFNANTSTNLIEDLYGIGVLGLQELYNSAVKSFNDAKEPEEVLKSIVESELSSIEKSKVEKPLEDSFITTDSNEWLKKMRSIKGVKGYDPYYESALLNDYLNFDYEIIKNAKAYSLGPVFSYKGKSITCETYKYDTIDELKDFLKDKQYVLYCLHNYVTCGLPNPDPTSFVPFIEGGEPRIRCIFRGSILNE